MDWIGLDFRLCYLVLFFIEMVYFHSSISLCNPVDQAPLMANNEITHRNRRLPNSSNSPHFMTCDRSKWVLLEVVLFIAVIFAFGFLFFPFIYYILTGAVEITCVILYAVKDEIFIEPSIYVYVGFGISFASFAVWGVLNCVCAGKKCGNRGCKGMRKSAEFDIQLETEDCVKNLSNEVVKKGLFEVPRDHHRELELELKKIAPINGRAVLILRARCGCSVGRLEVPGPKKPKKTKR